jgi:hypothetical protein
MEVAFAIQPRSGSKKDAVIKNAIRIEKMLSIVGKRARSSLRPPKKLQATKKTQKALVKVARFSGAGS